MKIFFTSLGIICMVLSTFIFSIPLYYKGPIGLAYFVAIPLGILALGSFLIGRSETEETKKEGAMVVLPKPLKIISILALIIIVPLLILVFIYE